MISFQIMAFLNNILDTSYMGFKLGLPSPFGLSWIVIVHEISPLASFSYWFSFRLTTQLNADFPINFGNFARTSLEPFKMLHLSHSTRIVSQRWKTMFKERRMFIHFFIDSTFKIGFNVSSNFCR
jgi:hypothetical protein